MRKASRPRQDGHQKGCKGVRRIDGMGPAQLERQMRPQHSETPNFRQKFPEYHPPDPVNARRLWRNSTFLSPQSEVISTSTVLGLLSLLTSQVNLSELRLNSEH